jgi:hypothetical protein
MGTTAPRRCGTCELLARSSYPGLETYGKCPHRDGWIRTHHAACELHLAERSRGLVRVAMAANLVLAVLGLGTLVAMDLREGSLLSHVLLGVILVMAAAFVWLVRRHDLLSEEPKFQLLDEAEPPPKDDDDRWMDLR